MRKMWGYVSIVLIITIIIPTVIVKTFNFVPKGSAAELEYEDEIVDMPEIEVLPSKTIQTNLSDQTIKVYDPVLETVISLPM